MKIIQNSKKITGQTSQKGEKDSHNGSILVDGLSLFA
jgi:hypothetical protein